MDQTRKADLQELQKMYDKTKSYKEKQRLNRIANNVRNENGKIRSMREALIKASRENNIENIKDIHEFIKNKEDYKKGRM